MTLGCHHQQDNPGKDADRQRSADSDETLVQGMHAIGFFEHILGQQDHDGKVDD